MLLGAHFISMDFTLKVKGFSDSLGMDTINIVGVFFKKKKYNLLSSVVDKPIRVTVRNQIRDEVQGFDIAGFSIAHLLISASFDCWP